MAKTSKSKRNFKYDVCLSFAGEDRKYVKQVASSLTEKGIRDFYDEYERAELWGKDLYTHLDDVYQNSARFCVLFVSKHFAKKLWSNHERESAQARAFRENKEYILPGRFDKTEIPGIRDTVGYINLQTTTPVELAELIQKKLGPQSHKNFLPPSPDQLFKRLKLRTSKQKDVTEVHAEGFLEALRRMSVEERDVVFTIFTRGCPVDLPDNIHINLDFLKRLTKFPASKLKRVLGHLRSLGFFCSLREETHDEYLGTTQVLALEWHYMGVGLAANATDVANEMIAEVLESYCEEHGAVALANLDFSALASATKSEHTHNKGAAKRTTSKLH